MDKSKIDISAINEKIKKESSFIDLLLPEVNKVIVGQQYMIERLLIGLLGKGHILLEGVPGLAKTLAINTLSQAVKGSFSRIQFTPDLLPADVIGTMIYNMKENDFSIKKVKELLNTAEGCKVVDENSDGGYITPVDAEGKNETFISRIRKDNSKKNSLNMWIVSDNLLRGAALNAVEIAEAYIKR